MDLKKSFGLSAAGVSELPSGNEVIQYINLKLAGLGLPVFTQSVDNNFLELAHDFIQNYREKGRILTRYLCPADQRIQNFIESYLGDYKHTFNLSLPKDTFILDKHGIARALSLPPDKDEYISDIISSYRIKQGILHNPKNDRRTTKGVFHIAEGGLPIPEDKKAVPKKVFAALLSAALNPPQELMRLPFTSSQKEQAETFLSLLLRPIISPNVPGVVTEKRMEIRFFAPGNLASNLDFVESIFGNAGDPFLLANDAAADIETWSGHTGCIILAPHLVKLKKKELGLPNVEEATPRQKRDGMCWQNEDEFYNEGQAFKITARTEAGVILTVIADNYFGYTKKEVKTQISYAANLFGNAEEEHAGGAIAFPSYNQGDEFHDDTEIQEADRTFEQMISMYNSFMDVKPEGYAVDKNFSDVIYVKENSKFDLREQKISWEKDGVQQSIRLSPRQIYILPAGFKIRMEKNPYIPSWRLVGTLAEGTFCHKPSTVSGGGKSEISKSILDSIIYGPFFTADFDNDFKLVEEIINKDYGARYKGKPPKESRFILSTERSLGSVIKLLTPSAKYSDEYNQWLESIPHYIKGLVYLVKRFYKEEWGENWKKYFSVDIIDDKHGHELKYDNRKLVASYLRIGLAKDNSWRTFKLRQDFIASDKIQMEDDITASIVVPARDDMYLPKEAVFPSVKFVDNCEYRFFQRPDEAIHRGFDKQAEADLASPNTFISNFEPLKIEDAQSIINDAIDFDKYSKPIKSLIQEVAANHDAKYFVSSSHPRIFEGKPSKNMRYLQTRPDLIKQREKYVAEVGARLYRQVPADKPVLFPVTAVIGGRRNNPPEPGVRSLAVYNPIHYQELPELFMDFICSLTGKSPSTTGAGSEGALTKGPFNSLCATTDLNNALVSFILTGYDGFSTAAGYVGPKYRVDHDISLLIPELWSRLRVEERNAQTLIKDGLLEKLNDFVYNGKKILASRLGYRITYKFVRTYIGRVFENPFSVFAEDMLKPELQSMETFVDGINNIVEAQQKVAQRYFDDGSIEAACPPLKAMLHIMVNNSYEGKTIDDPEIRNLFTREVLLESNWYKERLLNKQQNDVALWQKHFVYLHAAQENQSRFSPEERAMLQEKMRRAVENIKYCKSDEYLKSLRGYIGLDPLYRI